MKRLPLVGLLCMALAAASAVAARPRPGTPDPAGKHTVEVQLDASEMPEMQDWCHKAQAAIEQSYPALAEQLIGDDYTPPSRIQLTFKRGNKGIAGTAGTKIIAYEGWFKAHPGDVGALIHEAIHVMQSYPKYDPPWLVEGIADYLRFWVYEPKAKRGSLDPAKIRYQDGYQVTGAFLAWAVKTHDKDLVRKLNSALDKGQYQEDIFREATGKDLKTLFEEFKGSLKKP